MDETRLSEINASEMRESLMCLHEMKLDYLVYY